MNYNYLLTFLPCKGLALILCLLSCGRHKVPDELESVLLQAGSNRKSLDKVLKHFSKSKKDSLKYQAACYLILNMPGHFGIYHHNIDAPDAIFENIERTLRSGQLPISQQENLAQTTEDNAYIQYDIDVITSEFLINHIDNAFYAWENFPWCKNLNFKDFKTYILPYRVDQEPLTNMRKFFMEKYAWLTDSMKRYDDMARAFTLVHQNFYFLREKKGGWEYGKIQNMYDIVRLNNGLCPHETSLKNTITRSLGIICTYDEIPHWANRNNDHSWNAFLDSNNAPLIIDGTDSLYKHNYLHSAQFPIKPPGDIYLPSYLSVTPVKKAATVYRKTFSSNISYIKENNPKQEIIPEFFQNEFIMDVSDSYLTCYDINLKIHRSTSKTLAYLCLFKSGKVIPVNWGRIENGLVSFKNMGSDVLYFPAVFNQNKYYPIGNPFILQQDGEIKEIISNPQRKQALILYRKYPLFMNVLNYANRMYKGKFQGSNQEDFSDASDLYTIAETILIPTEVHISTKNHFRYFRYLPDTTKGGDISELVFYQDSSGIESPIKGNIIYRFEGPPKSNYSKAFDNDLNTYYESLDYGTWIGIDMGIGNEKRISKILFCPRTDTNFIIPKNEYELFYWDDGWKSLGRKIATDYKLAYYNVPEDALFWLHCHSGGSEERPFTYVNGKQIWW